MQDSKTQDQTILTPASCHLDSKIYFRFLEI